MRRHRVMMVLAGAAAVWCAAPSAVIAAPTARAGTWRTAIEVPGSGALNKGGNAEVFSVSCASAGNCAAGGLYRDGVITEQALVVSERNGTWGRARQVPGSGALNAGGEAVVGSVSCASAGNCAAGGSYTDTAGHQQAFVVSERNGTWGEANAGARPGRPNNGWQALAVTGSGGPAGQLPGAR